MSWNANEEKLLCHIVLDDDVADELSDRAGPAFFRGFIVQDRASGVVALKYRFRCERPDESFWFHVKPSNQQDEIVDRLCCTMLLVLIQGATLAGKTLPSNAIKFFYPPDDEGDALRTIEWLKEKDLIEITERISEEEARRRGLVPDA
jgi:hypothetical protein